MKYKLDKYRDIINEFCFFLVYLGTLKYNDKFWFFTSEYNISLFIIIMNSVILLIEILGSLIKIFISLKVYIYNICKKYNKNKKFKKSKN